MRLSLKDMIGGRDTFSLRVAALSTSSGTATTAGMHQSTLVRFTSVVSFCPPSIFWDAITLYRDSTTVSGPPFASATSSIRRNGAPSRLYESSLVYMARTSSSS